MDSLSSLNPNRRQKEEFVSNLSGSSMAEIAALSTIIPILVLIRHSLGPKMVAYNRTTLKKNDAAVVGLKSWSSFMGAAAVDFFLLVVPILLFLTILSEWTCTCAIILTLLVLLIMAAKGFHSCFPLLEGACHSLRTSITSYRVAMMIITCLCILAVDFQIFPRRYAKTETYGTSWMDLGVGSFVLANSLVSRQARNIKSRSWNAALKSTSPLIILGIIRLATTSGVDYQVHVGEYGVHWNFFFTLAAVSLLTSAIDIPSQYSGILGSLVLVGYQCCLARGLNLYLLSNERGADIVNKNKEGIFSIFGYWSLYLIGVQLGSFIFFGHQSSAKLSYTRRARILVWGFSLLFWVLTALLDAYVERVSRRTCNLPYVTLVLAENLQVLGILMFSEYVHGSGNSVLEEAFNRNLLAAFLLANVLTGLVNLSVDTIFVSPVSALLILLAYAFVLCTLTGLAHFYDVRLKFW